MKRAELGIGTDDAIVSMIRSDPKMRAAGFGPRRNHIQGTGAADRPGRKDAAPDAQPSGEPHRAQPGRDRQEHYQ